MSMVQRFEIQYKLPSLNEYIRANRRHWSKGAKFKQDIDDIIGWNIKASKLQEVKAYPITLNLVFYEPNGRRDYDNVVSATKYILDALQKWNIIKNDSPKYIAGITSKVQYGKEIKTHRVEVEILEKEIK